MKAFFSVAIGASVALAAAQAPRPIRPRVVVRSAAANSADAPRSPMVESFLAINPVRPDELLASAIVAGEGGNGAALYDSLDRGRTWARAAAGADAPAFRGADPVVYFANDGTAIFASLCDEPRCGLRLWRRTSAGTWRSSVVPGESYDREYLAVDGGTGPHRGRIYVAAGGYGTAAGGNDYPALIFTTSDDGGETFAPVRVMDITGEGAAHGFGAVADPVITSTGTLVVPIQSSPGLVPGPTRQIYTIASTDGGATFTKPRPGPAFERGPAGFRRTRTGSNIRFAIDVSSSALRDRIYASWVEYNNSDRFEARVSHSDDAGATWSPPVTLNDNAGPHDSSNLAIAVSHDGTVLAAWNDRRDDAAGGCFRTRVTGSIDGGDTWLPNVALRTAPTCPNTAANWIGSVSAYKQSGNAIVLSGAPARYANGGESLGLAADADGVFHLAWINGETGVMQLWHAALAVDRAGAAVVKRQDRSRDCSVEVSAAHLDFAAHTIGFDVRIRNRSSVPIDGPLTLVLASLQSDFGSAAALGSDNRVEGPGAAWTWPGHAPLPPGDQTAPMSIRWRFNGQLPVQTQLDEFRAVFRVLTAK